MVIAERGTATVGEQGQGTSIQRRRIECHLGHLPTRPEGISKGPDFALSRSTHPDPNPRKDCGPLQAGKVVKIQPGYRRSVRSAMVAR